MGEWRLGKRLNSLAIAKGSTWESWAHIDSLVDFAIAKQADIAAIRDLQNQPTGVLIATIRRREASRPAKRRRRTRAQEP